MLNISENKKKKFNPSHWNLKRNTYLRILKMGNKSFFVATYFMMCEHHCGWFDRWVIKENLYKINVKNIIFNVALTLLLQFNILTTFEIFLIFFLLFLTFFWSTFFDFSKISCKHCFTHYL